MKQSNIFKPTLKFSQKTSVSIFVHFVYDIPANNGEPFRFRIGSAKSAQLFQLSAENFFRLRYESVPLQ